MCSSGLPDRSDLAYIAQAENLESAGIGEYRPVPRHELVQAAEVSDQLVARPEIEVVRVGEDERGAHFAQLARLYGLDRRLRADRSENRRGQGAMRCLERTGPRGAVLGFE